MENRNNFENNMNMFDQRFNNGANGYGDPINGMVYDRFNVRSKGQSIYPTNPVYPNDPVMGTPMYSIMNGSYFPLTGRPVMNPTTMDPTCMNGYGFISRSEHQPTSSSNKNSYFESEEKSNNSYVEDGDIVTDISIKDRVTVNKIVGDYYAWGYPHDLLDFSLYVEKVDNLMVSTNAFRNNLCSIDDGEIDLVIKDGNDLYLPAKKTTSMYELIMDSLRFNIVENEFTLYDKTLFEIIFLAEDSPKELKLRILNNFLKISDKSKFHVTDIVKHEIVDDVVYLDTIVEYKGVKSDVMFKIDASESNLFIAIVNNGYVITTNQLPMLFLDKLIEEHKD